MAKSFKCDDPQRPSHFLLSTLITQTKQNSKIFIYRNNIPVKNTQWIQTIYKKMQNLPVLQDCSNRLYLQTYSTFLWPRIIHYYWLAQLETPKIHSNLVKLSNSEKVPYNGALELVCLFQTCQKFPICMCMSLFKIEFVYPFLLEKKTHQ